MVFVLVAAKTVKDRDGSKLGGYFAVVPGIWALQIVLLLIAAYVAGLLILTSKRVRISRWVLPIGIGFGAVTAGVLCALAPLGANVDPASPSARLPRRGTRPQIAWHQWRTRSLRRSPRGLTRRGVSGAPPDPQSAEQKGAEEHDNADEQQKQQTLDDDTHEAEHDCHDHEE